jgi:hypothetical protein
LSDITEKDVKGDGPGILFLVLDQLEVFSVLLPLSPVALVPPEEHPTHCSIARIAGHPNLVIVIYLSRMLPVSVQGSAFSLTVCVLVNNVLIVTQIFTQMFTDIAPGKSFAIRKSSGYFEQDRCGSGLSTSQY